MTSATTSPARPSDQRGRGVERQRQRSRCRAAPWRTCRARGVVGGRRSTRLTFGAGHRRVGQPVQHVGQRLGRQAAAPTPARCRGVGASSPAAARSATAGSSSAAPAKPERRHQSWRRSGLRYGGATHPAAISRHRLANGAAPTGSDSCQPLGLGPDERQRARVAVDRCRSRGDVGRGGAGPSASMSVTVKVSGKAALGRGVVARSVGGDARRYRPMPPWMRCPCWRTSRRSRRPLSGLASAGLQVGRRVQRQRHVRRRPAARRCRGDVLDAMEVTPAAAAPTSGGGATPVTRVSRSRLSFRSARLEQEVNSVAGVSNS